MEVTHEDHTLRILLQTGIVELLLDILLEEDTYCSLSSGSYDADVIVHVTVSFLIKGGIHFHSDEPPEIYVLPSRLS